MNAYATLKMEYELLLDKNVALTEEIAELKEWMGEDKLAEMSVSRRAAELVYITNEAGSKSYGYTEAQLLDALHRLWGNCNVQLEANLAKTTRAMQAAIDAGVIAMSENQRLTKHIEDYEEENVALKRIKEAAQRVANDESEGLIHFAVIGELRDALLTAEEPFTGGTVPTYFSEQDRKE